MDKLSDLLHQYSPQEPEEISLIKKYISEHFKVNVKVAVQNESILIGVSNASLANALRLNIPKIQAAADTKKRLIFRID